MKPSNLPVLVLVLCGSAIAPGQSAALVPPPPEPSENPITMDKVRLGQALFWDEQLSSTGTVACGTCHGMSAGGGDPRTAHSVHPGHDGLFGTPDDVHGSPGVIAQDANGLYRREAPFPLRQQVTARKAPTVLMAGYYRRQFWDGRAEGFHFDPTTGSTLIASDGSLEAQASGPPVSEVEMAHRGANWTGVAQRIANSPPLALAASIPPALEQWIDDFGYPTLFQKTFQSPGVTPLRIQMALAAYQRTLVPDQAPIDAFLAGDQHALTTQERFGFEVFAGRARCGLCHSAPLFFRQDFFNIGLRPSREDEGRFLVTGDPTDHGAFKVPTLRNIEQRAPYFHDGSQQTLEQVVDFYSRGGDFPRHQSNLIRPFTLDGAERAALLAFLRRPLTDPRVQRRQPPFDHPDLWSTSEYVPTAYGKSWSPGPLRPKLTAIEPPVLGSQGFTFAVDQAPAGSQLWMLFDVAPAQSRVFGMPFLVGATPQLANAYLGPLHNGGPGSAWKSVNMRLPNDPLLAGSTFYMQGFLVAPVLVLSTTNGLAITLFASN